MVSTTVSDRATIRHNLSEFKLRWLAHIEQWKAENRPATESSHDQQFWGDLLNCFDVNDRDIYLFQYSVKRVSMVNTYRPSSSVKLLEKLKPLEVNLCERADYGAELRKANVLPA